jgi:hypothetical protein
MGWYTINSQRIYKNAPNKWMQNLILNDTIINIKNLHKNVIFINTEKVEPYDLSYEYNK